MNKKFFILKKIARIFKENLREKDIICRWGGEEFVVILPYTPVDKAIYIAQKLRKAVKNHNFDEIKVTVSIGVSMFEGLLKRLLKKPMNICIKQKIQEEILLFR
ncbi:MAG: GGDEF domain-containing protein [Nautiliaceae bacterium]